MNSNLIPVRGSACPLLRGGHFRGDSIEGRTLASAPANRNPGASSFLALIGTTVAKSRPMTSDTVPSAPPVRPVIGCLQLFLGFLKIGLMGFGGVAAIARHIIVVDRAWLSEKDYAALLGIGQILPGPNVVNVSIMIGDRFRGPLGSLSALSGLMTMPLLILVGLAALYQHFAAVPEVQAGIAGTAAAAAGLVVGTALKMAKKLKPTRMALLFGILAFVAVGIAHMPMLPTVLIIAPLSIFAVSREKRS